MIVYDLEIEAAIPKKDEERVPGIRYCEGWHDFENMGIACLCAFDESEARHRVFCKDNLGDFKRLVDGRESFLAGFNNIAFDNKVLKANGIELQDAWCYDLLDEIKKSTGTFAGYGLDALATANHVGHKTGTGATAPVLWQQGRIGEVISYCLHDVWLTWRLMSMVRETGFLKDPTSLHRSGEAARLLLLPLPLIRSRTKRGK